MKILDKQKQEWLKEYEVEMEEEFRRIESEIKSKSPLVIKIKDRKEKRDNKQRKIHQKKYEEDRIIYEKWLKDNNYNPDTDYIDSYDPDYKILYRKISTIKDDNICF